jgi:hypothetical protein
MPLFCRHALSHGALLPLALAALSLSTGSLWAQRPGRSDRA